MNVTLTDFMFLWSRILTLLRFISLSTRHNEIHMLNTPKNEMAARYFLDRNFCWELHAVIKYVAFCDQLIASNFESEWILIFCIDLAEKFFSYKSTNCKSSFYEVY